MNLKPIFITLHSVGNEKTQLTSFIEEAPSCLATLDKPN